jgi:hypothetical protein
MLSWLQSSQHHPHNSHTKHKEVALLCLNTTIKPHSYLSVVEIQINIHLARAKPDNMTHVVHEDITSGNNSRWLSKSRAGSYLTLVHVFHAIPQGHPWVAHTPSQCTSCRQGRVSSNSVTVEATKFAGPHKSHMHQYIINSCSSRLSRHGP